MTYRVYVDKKQIVYMSYKIGFTFSMSENP